MLQDAQKIYFAGIGGIGMSALAQLLHADGKQVSGSDRAESAVTEMLTEKGIEVGFVQDGSELTEADILIYTAALPEDHPERERASELGIPELNYFQALGQYMEQFEYAVAISGTHGKTTTTAMLANILVEAGLNPTVVVGSIMKEYGSNARVGGKKYIVVEACEYQEHMLQLRPNMIVLTNVEADHLDYYTDEDHIVSAFEEYVALLPEDGVLVKNVDDERIRTLTSPVREVTYGTSYAADHEASMITVENAKQTFLCYPTEFRLKIPGEFNVSNALAAIAAARTLEVEDMDIALALGSFTGVWRRFQLLDTYKGAMVVSDYAHHPTAVRKTITAAREFYPDRRIFAVFQPHQRARTQLLFDEFVTAFQSADIAIIQEIYDVAGREEDQYASVSSRQLVAAVEGPQEVMFSENAEETRSLIDQQIQPTDLLLIMGAGDIYKLAENL